MLQYQRDKGFLESRIKMDDASHVRDQDIIIEPHIFDEVRLPVRPMKTGKQLVVKTMAESINKKKSDLLALLDSGCTRTCIDEEYAKSQGWPLQKIANPILIEYANSSSTSEAKIRYMVNLWLKAAGATVVTRALITNSRASSYFSDSTGCRPSTLRLTGGK
jgi:hypothetical protein